MKKQWISVKCGLSRDPKHRQKMGESIWLYLHILDCASWDDGIAHEWTDESAAEEMGMPVRTLRSHRRKLDELGYITCQQKKRSQDIVIRNWTNPREYSGKVHNVSDRIQTPLESEGDIKGDTKGDIKGSRKDVTPTLYSKNQISESQKPATGKIYSAYSENIGILTPMVSDSIKDAENEYPENWIVEAIGLAATNNKRNWRYCQAILKRWQTEGKDTGMNKPAPTFEQALAQAGYQ